MDKELHDKILFEYAITTFVQMEQFAQWLRKFFYLNQKLHEEFDTFYQDSFYVVFYQLITEGLEHINTVINSSEKNESTCDDKLRWYNNFRNSLLTLKSELSTEEIEFIEYKRHNVCHIFQNHYNQISRNGTNKKERKGKNLNTQEKEFMSIIKKHGSDKEFDIYLTQKLYPIIRTSYERLKQ